MVSPRLDLQADADIGTSSRLVQCRMPFKLAHEC
jgi:hypothetical protein